MGELLFVIAVVVVFSPLGLYSVRRRVILLLAAGSTSYNQSRVSSLLEQVMNVGIGFLISLLFWAYVIVPLWDLNVAFVDNLAITSLFTVLSVVRGYIIRRVFNLITAIAHHHR